MPDVAAVISELRDIPGPTLLVTSRERLQLQGEHVYAVPSLEQDDGIELFLARTRALASPVAKSTTQSSSSARGWTTSRSRSSSLPRAPSSSPPSSSLERLSQRLDLLKGGRDADPRQQTLRATIEWSYDLLAAGRGAAAVSRCLRSSRAAATYEAAEEIVATPIRTRSSRSSTRACSATWEHGETRYWMLETIRESRRGEARGVGRGRATRTTSPRVLPRPRRGRRRALQGRRVRARAARRGARQSPQRLRYRARARTRAGARSGREACPLLEPARPVVRRAAETRGCTRRGSRRPSLDSRSCSHRSRLSRLLADGS